MWICVLGYVYVYMYKMYMHVYMMYMYRHIQTGAHGDSHWMPLYLELKAV